VRLFFYQFWKYFESLWPFSIWKCPFVCSLVTISLRIASAVLPPFYFGKYINCSWKSTVTCCGHWKLWWWLYFFLYFGKSAHFWKKFLNAFSTASASKKVYQKLISKIVFLLIHSIVNFISYMIFTSNFHKPFTLLKILTGLNIAKFYLKIKGSEGLLFSCRSIIIGD